MISMSSEEANPRQCMPGYPNKNIIQPQWISGIVKGLIVLNLLDSIFTLIWVRTGVAEESNIFLENLVNENALCFMLVKVALVSLGSLLLWRYRHHLFAVIGLFLAFTTYLMVTIYHLHFLNLLAQLI
jgi:hypothetical protein